VIPAGGVRAGPPNIDILFDSARETSSTPGDINDLTVLKRIDTSELSMYGRRRNVHE
jgi:hypothetical protein